MARIPIAWLQLSYERLRLMAALAGIAFAVVLMLVQLGLWTALFDAGVLLYSHMKADLFVVSGQYEYIIQSRSFPRQRLKQVLAVDGVESATPVYIGLASWKNPLKLDESALMIVGFDPRSHAVTIPEVESKLQEISMPDVVLYDMQSNPKFGPIADLYKTNPRLSVEINRRRVRVGGIFNMGMGFAAVGNVFTSDTNFARLFPNRYLDDVDVGLVRLKAGVDSVKVRDQLQSFLPSDVRVMTREEFLIHEKLFWDKVSPIGFIFAMGVLMGFVVGTVIVYQILYTDVSDHLAEYATLKAMGYGDGYLFSVVFKESLLLSVLGYIPGFLVTLAVYSVTTRNTGLLVSMTWERAVTVLLLTIFMCCASGALAMRRIRSADPAEIF